jgi:pimeloyl-ACP methyl ester carboxylesterase
MPIMTSTPASGAALPAGVESRDLATDRIRIHYLESGPADGEPVVLLHGNLSTGRFWQRVMARLPDRYRVLAPDMRGFGDTEDVALDATRGLADWADDTALLLSSLGIDRPAHLVGWSTGGAAIAALAADRPVASLTFVDPVSPHGYGGVHPDGTPCAPDYAGSGGGGINPEVVERLQAGDTTDESPFGIRNVIRAFYVAAGFQLDPEWEDLLVTEVLKTVTGANNYPGDMVESPNWPGFGPGTSGILNALSPKYCNWTSIVELDPKPPVLWTHGATDLVVSDASPLEIGAIGAAGQIPGWPGLAEYPPQPMVRQIRDVLDQYAAAGGSVQTELFAESGHGPFLDAEDEWIEVFSSFLGRA